MNLNNSNNVETVELYLDEYRHPIAFNNKLNELIKSGMMEDEARSFINSTPFELEVYYDPFRGLFLVESEACEYTDIYNPYTGEVCKNEANEQELKEEICFIEVEDR